MGSTMLQIVVGLLLLGMIGQIVVIWWLIGVL